MFLEEMSHNMRETFFYQLPNFHGETSKNIEGCIKRQLIQEESKATERASKPKEYPNW